ncbi:MAG TPA: ABC transporter permease [Candidatus Dormibacteraeota bacterium]|nr:ABC transporter permease [Candidatus Dormibacteraeota bacterium]
MSRALWPIARMTLVEASRRRLLIALTGLTLAVIAVVGYGFSKLPSVGGSHPLNHDDLDQIASVLTILTFFMFSFVLSFASIFVAAPAISADVESGVMLSIATRPLRRADIVVGRWLGLAFLVAVYTIAATTIDLEVVNLVIGYLPPHPVEAITFLVAEGVVAVTLAMLFSTRLAPMTGGIVATILLLVVWFGGIVGNIGYAFGNDTVAMFGTISRIVLPTDGMWRGALYYLQTPQLLAAQALLGRRAAGNPFFAPNPPALAYLAWTVAWIVGLLGLATWSFRNREL